MFLEQEAFQFPSDPPFITTRVKLHTRFAANISYNKSSQYSSYPYTYAMYPCSDGSALLSITHVDKKLMRIHSAFPTRVRVLLEFQPLIGQFSHSNYLHTKCYNAIVPHIFSNFVQLRKFVEDTSIGSFAPADLQQPKITTN